MIYQFYVQLKGTQPLVWRRLQVDSEMTFDHLHEVLQAAFDWENSHLHEFTILKTNGRKRRGVEIGPILEGFGFAGEEALDEEDEYLSDWFVAEKDQALYIYDFGDDWQHDIVLERILVPETGAEYPRCVAAAEWAPEEDSMGRKKEQKSVSPATVKAKVNKALAPLIEDVEIDDEEDIWKRLLLQSKELNGMKPWEYLDDDEIFMVVDPVSQERLFISVLGGAGREFGLAVYIGEEGFKSLQLVVEQSMPLMDVVFIQRSLLLSFVDRNELASDDYDFLKAHGVAFRGKKQWPEFRSMVPGSYPWSIDREEARILLLAIEQTGAVLEMVKQGQDLPLFMQEDEMFARIPQTTDAEPAWENARVQVDGLYKSGNSVQATEQFVSELEVLRASKQPVFNSEIEFDVFYINMPVQEQEGMRPYFPLMAAAVDSRSGMALYQDIFESQDQAEAAQLGLLDFIEKFGQKPGKLLLKKAAHQALEPILSALKVDALEVAKLPEMEQLKAFLSQMNS